MSDKDKDDAAARKAAYDAELPSLTAELEQRFLAATERAGSPTAVFTGGQPGSGKSQSIVRALGIDYAAKGGIAVIDPDELRPLFAQAASEQLAGEYTAEAYEAAGTLAYQVSVSLAPHKRNILRDGSLQSATWPVREIAELKRHDYQVEIHVAAVNLEVSHARTEARRWRDASQSDIGFGRTVDRSFHDRAAAGVVDTAQTLWTLEAVDRFVLYDAAGSVVMDRLRDASGTWTESSSGKPHAGLEPPALIEHHQKTTTPADLVHMAEAWMVARDSMDIGGNPSEDAIAVVDGRLNASLDAVRADAEASAHAAQHGRPGLQERLLQRVQEPLRAQADAWLRDWRADGATARRHWPEFGRAFDLADAVLRDGAEQATKAGKLMPPGSARYDRVRRVAADHIAQLPAERFQTAQETQEPQENHPPRTRDDWER